MSGTRTSALAALALAALCIASVPSQAASPYQRSCKPTITTVGQHKHQLLAQKIAKQSWAQQAAAMHGSSWASLSSAGIAQGGCEFGQGGQPGWTCVFAARPCRVSDTRGITPHKPGTVLKRMQPTW